MLSSFPIKKLEPHEFPKSILEIPKPPKQIFVRGVLPDDSYIKLAVVGSRKYSTYGKAVCQKIIQELRGYPVCIVSGLALGIDSIAHEEALKAGLKTVAIPGSGLDEKVLYPRSNFGLADRILNHGGCLLSEFEPSTPAAEWTFPQRNRIMAGLVKAVLVIEAEQKSGTLITARLATDYNRDVLTVPGSVFESTSAGPLMLIKLGATPVSSGLDVLEALGIQTRENLGIESEPLDITPDESIILSVLSSPCSRDEILAQVDMDSSKLNMTLTLLEIKDYIQEVGGKIHRKR